VLSLTNLSEAPSTASAVAPVADLLGLICDGFYFATPRYLRDY
jgi:hypothetical protein